MKKFVTTLAALFAALALSVGFAACGDGENEVYEQVTEEQWSAALDLVGGDPDKINLDNLNMTIDVTSEGKMNGQAINTHSIQQIDFAHNAVSMSSDFMNLNVYIWHESNIAYMYAEHSYMGFTEKQKDIIKRASSVQEFFTYTYDYLNNNSEMEILGGELLAVKRFSEFEFNEKTGAYTATFESDNERIKGSSTVKLYFRDGKLAKSENYLNCEMNDLDNDLDLVYENYTITSKYTYGTANVIVPQEIKDMPITEY